MRFLIIALSVSAMALATGAFAQTTPQSPPADQTTPQSPPQLATGKALDFMEQEHPNWFADEKKMPYRPCPTSVVLANGQHVCLGCPTVCEAHF
jgi:hypothetical protein